MKNTSGILATTAAMFNLDPSSNRSAFDDGRGNYTPSFKQSPEKKAKNKASRKARRVSRMKRK